MWPYYVRFSLSMVWGSIHVAACNYFIFMIVGTYHKVLMDGYLAVSNFLLLNSAAMNIHVLVLSPCFQFWIYT